MRIKLPERTELELLAIMQKLNLTSPTHCINLLVSRMHQQLNIPASEDSINAPTSKAPTH